MMLHFVEMTCVVEIAFGIAVGLQRKSVATDLLCSCLPHLVAVRLWKPGEVKLQEIAHFGVLPSVLVPETEFCTEMETPSGPDALRAAVQALLFRAPVCQVSFSGLRAKFSLAP
jgi:hypothetical protein